MKIKIQYKITMGICLMTSFALAEDVKNTDISDEILQELNFEQLNDLPMIDIATGYAVPLEKAPAVATVITAKEIKAMGAETLDDILETVPGLHNIPATFSGKNSATIRGIYTSFNPQVLFLMNGYRLSSFAFSGSVTNNLRINVKNISRVEVVRGPGSAVYGADAFSGVINIITKNAHELKNGQVGAGYGSNNVKNLWAQYGFHFDNNWHLATNIEFAQRDADKSRKISSDLQSNFDQLFNTNASVAPSYIDQRYKALTYGFQLYNEHWKLNVNGTSQRDNGLGAGIVEVIDHKGKVDLDQILLGFEYHHKNLFRDLEFKTNLSYFHAKIKGFYYLFPAGSTLLIGKDGNLDFNTPGVPVTFSDGFIGSPGATTKVPQLESTFIYTGVDFHTFRLNIGVKTESLIATNRANFGPGVLDNPVPLSVVNGTLTSTTGTDFSYVKDGRRTIQFLSLQDVWEINADWTFTGGIRYDHYSDFGKTINPRLALVWAPTSNLTTKLLHGWAFRAPSFSELNAINNPAILGNPNLEPETIKTTEFALSWEIFENFTLDSNLYYFKTKNMIDYFENDNSSSTAQNNQSLIGKGIELAMDWKFHQNWHMKGNYAYQKTIDTKTKQQQAFVPKQFAYLNIDWHFIPDWQLSTQVNWIADRQRVDGDLRKDINDYTLVNLSLLYQYQSWKAGITVKNVFDRKAYEPSDGKIPDDYPLNERQLFFSVEYTLK